MPGNVLFITVDQWRGDCLSVAGHPVVETPTLDRLAASGVRFANHWANAAPCGPSRACLYTGTYLHHHRSVQNGTPLDARFTNVALVARQAGYNPVLFGYTDTSVDPRTVPLDDPRLFTYEGVLPGFDPIVVDPWCEGSPAWGRWLTDRGVDVPGCIRDLYRPVTDFPGAADHGASWAPAGFSAENSETAFLVERLIDWLDHHGDKPFFIHASFIRPHPPYRNPPGYHDRYDADAIAPFVAAPTRDAEAAVHPFNQLALANGAAAAPERELDRRQLRATYYGAQREVDDRLGELFEYLDRAGLAADTLVVLTSDHGEMGCDHWLTEKLGYWDESYYVPLIVCDPRSAADGTRGSVVDEFTESVDVLPTLCDWMGVDVPAQVDGMSLRPFVHGEPTPQWRTEAHFEWDFSMPDSPQTQETLGLPLSHSWLAVVRGRTRKYVQFAAASSLLPPLLFDLESDPLQLDNLAGDPTRVGDAWAEAQRLLQWRMRNEDRTLSGHFLSPEQGLVMACDEWR
jgi:arylsulfatase A-like enzyme